VFGLTAKHLTEKLTIFPRNSS